MSQSPLALPVPAPIGTLERRIQWRVAPVVAFIGILIGLGVVAAIPMLRTPPLLVGLPDDPDLGAARRFMIERTLPASGPLRWRAELLGEGGVTGAWRPIDQARAEHALAQVERAKARRYWDARVWAAAGSLRLVAADLRGAEREYRAALDRTPEYGEARLGLGVTLALRARRDARLLSPRALELAALAQFMAVPARDPGYASALWDRAVLLREVGREDEARRAAEAYRVEFAHGRDVGALLAN